MSKICPECGERYNIKIMHDTYSCPYPKVSPAPPSKDIEMQINDKEIEDLRR